MGQCLTPSTPHTPSTPTHTMHTNTHQARQHTPSTPTHTKHTSTVSTHSTCVHKYSSLFLDFGLSMCLCTRCAHNCITHYTLLWTGRGTQAHVVEANAPPNPSVAGVDVMCGVHDCVRTCVRRCVIVVVKWESLYPRPGRHGSGDY